MSKLITSQHYVDDEIVAAKIASGDFEVQVSPEFEIGGETFRVILDGHHSFTAAQEAGVEAMLVEMSATENDKVTLLANGQIESFLESCWMDGDYVYAGTGKAVW